jgi:hypothetical protein
MLLLLINILHERWRAVQLGTFFSSIDVPMIRLKVTALSSWLQ